ncbi:MAG: nucleotidyltransferase domain-containing protein [Candidatus Aminicenantes bacterium]|nr:nucleotidyltransferase domain-containing protein [Candidatus Aminicenantes bacterium]
MISLRSEITRKLLNYFFINPQENLYVNELSRKLDLDKRNLVKKLKELEKDGIIKSQIRGNIKLYSINKSYPLYEEYKKIILKTIGVEDKFRRILTEVEGIKEAYIYGSYAKNKMDIHSDIDLLVIGDHKISLLQKNLNKLQREIDREINSISMDELEFKKRIKKKDPFIVEILENKHIQLIQ